MMTIQMEALQAVLFLSIGLSHLLQPEAWRSFFEALLRAGHGGALFEGLLYLWAGGLIVVMHPVWSGVASLLTLVGVALLLKGLSRLVAPHAARRAYARAAARGLWAFRISGLLAMLLGALCAALAISGGLNP